MVSEYAESPAVCREQSDTPFRYSREEQEKIEQVVREIADRRQRRTCLPSSPRPSVKNDILQPLIMSGAAALLIAAASILIPRFFPSETAEFFRIDPSASSAESTLLTAYRESSRKTLEGKEEEIRRIRKSIERIRGEGYAGITSSHRSEDSDKELSRFREELSQLEHQREILASMLQSDRAEEAASMAVGMGKPAPIPVAVSSRTEESVARYRAALADAAEARRFLESENVFLRQELARKEQERNEAVMHSTIAVHQQAEAERRLAAASPIAAASRVAVVSPVAAAWSDAGSVRRVPDHLASNRMIERLLSLLNEPAYPKRPAVLPSKELYRLLESKIRIKEILDSPDIKGRYPDLYDQMERYNLALREEEKAKSVTSTIDDLVILTETVRSGKDPASIERIIARYGKEGYAGRLGAFLTALGK